MTPPASASSEGPRVAEALGLFAAAVLLLIVLGSLTQRWRPGPLAVALTEMSAILLPALLWSRARHAHPLSGLGLWPPRPGRAVTTFVGGLLCGAAWFYLIAAWVEPQLERIVPMPEGERRHLLRLLLPPGGPRPLWQDLACFAAAPALCEEVLFRGVLLPVMLLHAARAAGPRLAAVSAAVGSALLFGAFHLSAAKLLPTAALGLGFGLAALLGRSLWAAVAMHFANNALVILLVRAGHEAPPPLGPGPLLLGLSAAGSGVVLLMHGNAGARSGGGAAGPGSAVSAIGGSPGA